MAEGWAKVSGTWYYLMPGSGAMKTGWLDLNGTWYYLDGSGAMVTGSRTINGKTNLFNKVVLGRGSTKLMSFSRNGPNRKAVRQNGSSWSTPIAARSVCSTARKATGICNA